MEVSVTALRAGLAGWIDRVQEGEEVVVTQRGRPVARVLGVGSTSLADRLIARGVVTPPRGPESVARGSDRLRATGPVADLVGEQRRAALDRQIAAAYDASGPQDHDLAEASAALAAEALKDV